MDSHLNSQLIKFNIANIKLCTEIEGPFKRCCIWFQGCNIHCSGCCNKKLQALKPNHIVSIDELLSIVKEAKEQFDIEGITISGGEPSLQHGLSIFNNELHKLGLGVILFSGKLVDCLDKELIMSCDLLIAGPYIKEQHDNDRILIGSKNKKLIDVSGRYKNELTYFTSSRPKEEVCIGDFIFVNGD